MGISLVNLSLKRHACNAIYRQFSFCSTRVNGGQLEGRENKKLVGSECVVVVECVVVLRISWLAALE